MRWGPAAAALFVVSVVAGSVVTVVGTAPVVAAAGTVDSGATHGNHVAVDAQVSETGVIRAEEVSTLTRGWIVLHDDDGGEPGNATLGQAWINSTGFRSDVPVRVDDAVWADWSGTQTVWAVVHRDDGDQEFDPADDPSLVALNPTAKSRFALAKRDGGTVNVIASGFRPQQTTNATVTVPRVTLREPGHVVLIHGDGESAEPVGSRALAAGSHRNVSVRLDADFFTDQQLRFQLRAVAYSDDGDGTFDAADEPVTVDGTTVASSFVVEKTDNASVEPDDGGLLNTPTGTPTPERTETPTATPTAEATTDTETTVATPTTGSSATGPGGFGLLGALVALTVVATRRWQVQ
jgi:hypothetical protein